MPNAAITIALANCTIVAIPTAVRATAPNRPTIAVVTTPVIITPDISRTTGHASVITCQRITFRKEFRMKEPLLARFRMNSERFGRNDKIVANFSAHLYTFLIIERKSAIHAEKN